MKKINLVLFVLMVLVLAGAGCYGTPSTSAPETNTSPANTPEINIVVPTNENTNAPTNENIPPQANVNQPAEENPKTATVVLENFFLLRQA